MRETMPQSVKVGPHVYVIVLKPKAAMGNDLGCCKFDEVQIWIRERLRRSKQQEVVWHEVTHACTHPALNDGKRHTDEEFVESVSLQSLGVLRDNPELIAYLTT